MKKATVQGLNKDRFAFMFASMVGRKVTVKLRNLTSYEGIFGGSSMDKGDYTILLRMAHELPSESRLSGPVHDQMIILGKDIVMVNCLDVPEDGVEGRGEVEERGGDEFKTDVEIKTKRGFTRGDRHLESWADLKDEGASQDMELDHSKKAGGWSGPQDQFAVAEKMGVVSTYSEELYTTPLDYSQLTSAQRARAEQIAKEIEGGRNYSSQEEGGDDNGDEEAKFSAVIGTGGYAKKSGHPSETASSWRKPMPATAASSDMVSSSSANTRLNALNLEPASARSSAAAALKVSTSKPTPPPAATTPPGGTSSEMKGINALNLEPASVSRGGAGWDPANSKYKTTGGSSNLTTKRDFELALAEINSRPAAGKGKGKGKFSFNPNASTFTPGGPPAPPAGNTLNIAITPGGSLSGTLKSAGNYDMYEPPAMMMFPHGMMPMPMMPPPVHPMGPPPIFTPLVETSQMDKRSISDMLAKLGSNIPSSSQSSSFEWASASSASPSTISYKDVLGPIPPGVTPMMPPMMPPPMMAPGGYPMPYAPFYPTGPPGGNRGRPFQAYGGFHPQHQGGGYHRGGGNYRGGGSGQQSASE